jgi:apolipoprotein N-acyltransferase
MLGAISLIFAVASGILLFLSFPKFGSGLIAWVAIVPLLHALKGKNVAESTAIGFITGFLYNIGLIYWVTYAIVKYGNMPVYTGIVAMLLLSAYLAVYTALFSSGVAYLNKKDIPLFLSAPLLWTSLEYAKSQLFTGFPWENLAYSQYLNIKFIQIADITGIYGITFLIVFMNALIHDTVFAESTPKIKISKILAAALLIIGVFGYGSWRIKHIDHMSDRAESINVNLIQGNIDQGIKWSEREREEIINVYRDLSMDKSENKTGLIIWPETAVPFYFQDVDDLQRVIIGIAKSTNRWLLTGSPRYTKENNDIYAYNSAFLISPEGTISGTYDKVHLVPFGEYVPLRKYLSFMDKIVFGIGDFRAGSGYDPLLLENLKIGVMICYEGIFPEAGRSYKEKGVHMLVNITNDAWYGRTSAPYQHLSMVIFRSIENRLFLVRAANTGISSIIDATGRITSKTELFERTSLQGNIKVLEIHTFYEKYGDIFAYICLAVLILIIGIPRRKGERVI